MHVLALQVDTYLAEVRSLKAKRSAIRPVLEGAHRRFRVASAEVGDADAHQRAVMGFVAVSGSVGHCTEVIDEVERFVWSFPEVVVVDSHRSWLEDES